MNRICLAGHAAGGELVAEFVVDVPAVAGRCRCRRRRAEAATVAEHELRARCSGRGRRGRCWRGASRRSGSAAAVELAGDWSRGQAEQTQVQGGLRPSVETLSMLSSSGSTARLRTGRPGRPSSAMKSSQFVGWRHDDGLGARCPSAARRPGRGRVAGGPRAVLMSAETCHIRSISGTLRNFANRVCIRNREPPSGASLEVGVTLPERGGPGVEVGRPCSIQEVGAQVALHGECFGDAVGDRGGGRERGDPAAVPAAQVVRVSCPGRMRVGSLRCDAGDVGDGPQVFVVVGFVDDQVVDAGFFEGDTGVLDGVGEFLQPFLGAAAAPLPGV